MKHLGLMTRPALGAEHWDAINPRSGHTVGSGAELRDPRGLFGCSRPQRKRGRPYRGAILFEGLSPSAARWKAAKMQQTVTERPAPRRQQQAPEGRIRPRRAKHTRPQSRLHTGPFR